MVTKLKDEGIGTGGGSSPFGVPLPTMPGIGGLVSTGASNFVKGGGPKLAAGSLGLGLAGAAGIYGGHKLEESGYSTTGKVVHGVGTAASIGSMALAGGAIGTLFGPGVGTAIGYALGGLAGAIINWEDTAETFKDVGKMFSDSIEAFSKHPYPSVENTTMNNLMTELIPLIVKLTGLGSNKDILQKEYNNPEVVDSVSKLIQSESNNNPRAINAATGAAGLYQFMPSTAIDTARKLREDTGDESFDQLITSGGGSRASGMIQNMSPEQQTKLFHKYQEPLFQKVKTARGSNAVPNYGEMKAFNFASSYDPNNPEGVLYDTDNPKGKAAIGLNPELQAIANASGGKVTNKNLVEYFNKPANQPQLRQLRTPTTASPEGTTPPVEFKKPSPLGNPITTASTTYKGAVVNDELKIPQQTQGTNIINTTNNVGGTSTTSSQKEARDRFLPMPNYFYNVDGTSCAC